MNRRHTITTRTPSAPRPRHEPGTPGPAAAHEQGWLEAAFIASPVGMAVTDRRGRFLRVNRAFIRITGFAEDELRRKSLLDFTHDRANDAAALRAIVTGRSSIWTDERRLIRRDGRAVWVQSTMSALSDEHGTRTGLMVQVQDVSQRRDAEEAQRKSEQFVRDIAQMLPVLIYLYDLGEQRWMYSNQVGLGMLGYAATDLPSGGMELFERILHPDDVRQLPEDRARVAALADGEVHAREIRVRHANGSWRTMYSRAMVYLRDAEGHPRQLLGTLEDITERQALESQLRHSQKMEAIGQLAGGIAHDFNNLLTVILGYAETLRASHELEHPLRSDAEQIVKAGKRAASLTQQLLAFARRQVLTPMLLDLNLVLRDLESMLQRLIGEDITLRVEPCTDPAWVRADPAQIEQVIMNLVLNGRDAMPRGGALSLSTRRGHVTRGSALDHDGAAPGAYVFLRVRDTGEGMDALTRSHIFEPFFTTKEPNKGTGLGLSMVYGIVKQSGGHIVVNSEPGRGTTFDVMFPMAEFEDDPDRGATPLAGLVHGFETLLLVEDDRAVRRMARDGLERRGYHVLEAASGEEALDLARGFRRTIHATITDVVMPGLSGSEFVRRLLAMHPETKVLFVSGYGNDTDRGDACAGRDYLAKPFTPAALARAVRGTLDASPTTP